LAKKILVSFKETPEDLKLYKEIQSHSDKSAFIKDHLRGIQEKNIQKVQNNQIQSNELSEIMNL
jgi:hypothetical protein